MSIFLTQDIANLIAIELNDIAKDLQTAGDILTKFVFYGTSDLSTYERIQTGEYNVDQYEKITPFLLRSTNFAQQPEDYTRYEEAFELSIFGFYNEKTDLEKVFNTYTNLENTVNRVIAEGIYRIEKSVSKIFIYPTLITAMDGTLEDRIEGSLSFIWSIAEGIVTSDDITIKLDNVEIPYNVLSLISEKRNILSEPITSTGIDKYMSTVTGQSLSMNLPYLTSNSKLIELFQDVWNKTYNKQYLLTITIGENISYSDYVTLSSGTFEDPKPTILSFGVLFKRVQKQTEIYINNVLVPVLDFGFVNQAEISPVVKINEDSNKSTYISSNFGISMTLPLQESDDNSAIADLFSKVLDGLFGTSYTIRIVRNTYFSRTYNVILTNGSYNFEHDTSGSIELDFTEEDVE